MAIICLPKGRIPKKFEATPRTLIPYSSPKHKDYAEFKITCDSISPRPHGRNMYIYFSKRELVYLKQQISEVLKEIEI